MIARIWRGRTKLENEEEYTRFMKTRAIPDYQKTSGFVKLSFLKQLKKNEAHFTLITYWENLEVIKNFAGEDFEKAKYYPEDNLFLLAFEEYVEHHLVFVDI
ncbi:antibiotic biosynthesis monooxygenase [Maribacter sp. 2210JD10-5]|uniref:antibiotic biosynthesis monooxygenase n=1 Tax=Maribacter sp. 2210JD10-5 TaxID=3386272 RepID=UPI0039BD24DF